MKRHRILLVCCILLVMGGFVQNRWASADEPSNADNRPSQAKFELKITPETSLEDLRKALGHLPRLRVAFGAGGEPPPEGGRGPRPTDRPSAERRVQRDRAQPAQPRQRGERQMDATVSAPRGPSRYDRGSRPGPMQRDGRFGPDNRGPDNRGPDNRGPDNRGPDNRGPDNRGPDNRGPDNRGPDNRGPDNRGPHPDPPGRPDMRAPGTDLMRAVVEDKLAFVEKAMQAILEAKQEAMHTQVALVEMEAKLRIIEETAKLRLEAVKQEVSLEAKLAQQSTERDAERAVQEARREADMARLEVNALRGRMQELEGVRQHVKELEDMNGRLRQELSQWRHKTETLEAANRELRQALEANRAHPHGDPDAHDVDGQ